MLACNGAVIQDKRKIYYKSPMAKDIIDTCWNFGKIHQIDVMLFAAYKTFCTPHLNSISKAEIPTSLYTIKTQNDYLSARKEDIVKFAYMAHSKDEIETVYYEWEKVAAENNYFSVLEWSKSGQNIFGITNKNVNKGSALHKLAQMLNIPVSNVMAIGNNDNDIPMLLESGIGVAVGNATEKAKESANYIVSDVSNCGVAEAITKFVLEK